VRVEEKENICPTLTLIVQVEGEIIACGFGVSLTKSTVNRYVSNVMVRSAPLARRYKGIIPKTVFKLLVLTVESFIQIKQVNWDVIVQNQLLVVINTMWGIKSDNKTKENMFEQVMRSTTVSLDFTVAPAVKE
jgi:hypothetical protein